MIDEHEINRICDEVETEYSTKISGRARHLIKLSGDAFESEPSPRWSGSLTYRAFFSGPLPPDLQFRDLIRRELQKAAKARPPGGIDYFFALHWIADIKGFPVEKD